MLVCRTEAATVDGGAAKIRNPVFKRAISRPGQADLALASSTQRGGRMRAEWDESFFEADMKEDASVYWVCFWTGDDEAQAAQHDPQRVTGADSVEEVLAWIARERGDRRYELFTETVDHAESPDEGWTACRNLVRLAGDFRPAGSSVTIILTREE